MTRLRDAILRARADGRAFLAAYWPAGYPSPATDAAFLRAVASADLVEVGVPFSDPSADGPVLQAASRQALDAGATVQHALDRVRDLRAEHAELPLALMTYANLVHHSGWEGFARRAAEAGADALILPDVPMEESGSIRAALADNGLAWVPFASPVSGVSRVAAAASQATGFLYLTANVGLTGQAGLPATAEATVRSTRAACGDVPLLAGFGVRGADDVRRLHRAGADGAIVGSALVERAPEGPEAVGRLVRALHGGGA